MLPGHFIIYVLAYKNSLSQEWECYCCHWKIGDSLNHVSSTEIQVMGAYLGISRGYLLPHFSQLLPKSTVFCYLLPVARIYLLQVAKWLIFIAIGNRSNCWELGSNFYSLHIAAYLNTTQSLWKRTACPVYRTAGFPVFQLPFLAFPVYSFRKCSNTIYKIKYNPPLITVLLLAIFTRTSKSIPLDVFLYNGYPLRRR